MAHSKASNAKSKEIKFTAAKIEALPTRDKEYSAKIEGYRGMRCRVFPSGKKVIEVARKPRGCTNQVRVQICVYGDLPLTSIIHKKGNKKPGDSVESIYYDINTDLLAGKNPNIERKLKEASKTTLAEAFEDYKEASNLAPGTVKSYAGIIDNHFSDWKDLPLESITGSMVRKKHQDIKGDYAANNAMRTFRAIWNFAAEPEDDDSDGNPLLPTCPTRVLKVKASSKRKGWNKESRRQGQIEPHELKTWWQATKKIASMIEGKDGKQIPFYSTGGGDGELARDYLQFVIMTGLRRREASKLKWDTINLKGKHFTVAESKSGEPLTLPLPQYLVDMLTRRKKSKKCKDGPFPVDEVKRFVQKVRDLSGLEFTVHDLRRSFIGYCNDCDLGSMTIKALVNHTVTSSSGDVTEGYLINTHRRLRPHMDKIAAFVLSNAGAVDNVVSLEARGKHHG